MAYKLRKCCLVSLCLLSVLCVGISLSQAQDPHIDTCYSYYEEILDIQEQRTLFQDGLEQLLDLFAQGKVSKKELDMASSLWHTVESRLKAQVTGIYAIAYAEGCFETTK